MHRYYIYNKYFVNKLANLSLYQKSFINNNNVNKIKFIYWFNYKIVIGSHRKVVNVNFNLTQINSWSINYNQWIQNKIEIKLHMKSINCACCKLGKNTRSISKYNVAMDPGIKINKSIKSKKKILQTDWPRVFSSITQNSIIFFAASMEAKNQLDFSIPW